MAGPQYIFGGPKTDAVLRATWSLHGGLEEPLGGSVGGSWSRFSDFFSTLEAAWVQPRFLKDVRSEVLTFGSLGPVFAEPK